MIVPSQGNPDLRSFMRMNEKRERISSQEVIKYQAPNPSKRNKNITSSIIYGLQICGSI